jgi:FdrA protein
VRIGTLVRAGAYQDSIALMQIAAALAKRAGVLDASAVMGTEANKGLLAESGLLELGAEAATPQDLIVAISAVDDPSLTAALAEADRLLSRSVTTASPVGAVRPRSLRSAVRAHPEANVAVISVAGPFAVAPAWDALRAGLHVLLFSDHVSFEDELSLKCYARDHGLLLMGPGAGTAILNGIGLGFANVVPRGPLGIVAAAGTGLQEVSTLLAKAGVGVSQAIGTGGRDVGDRVGGIMLLEGLRALDADPETEVIVVVSKVSARAVSERLGEAVAGLRKRVVLALMGAPGCRIFRITGTRRRRCGRQPPSPPRGCAGRRPAQPSRRSRPSAPSSWPADATWPPAWPLASGTFGGSTRGARSAKRRCAFG